ncbi:bifunctional GNAT family N-acetyltransferase/hotdog fold thioesterase [Colwellia psychrerythraea]|uniref:Acetyltransferase, GNAT family n=1 Tax=Colwellia psychrerythraea (strain 34H / ATCC BAA-681) TaxID=167879 RepID=Q487W4_COLP3|nr:bifunctional GNAT family N-acetyltransferase/hotdog fold thioesterase [Colwellia psychrerythraea]AAZ25690.1 acetyltransferase, GNAT family [Colwellia psychrerythraea 34H]
MNVCRSPKTALEFEQYYQLRWQILRQPWEQALGSERDSLEQESIHRMILDENDKVIAVGRLEKSDQFSGQIRFMAVSAEAQGQGLGQKIIEALEHQAQKLGLTEITLNAREDAVGFYQKLGYSLQGFSHLLFDEIKHFVMNKALAHAHDHQEQVSTALQEVWHKTIPLSKVMNIKISYFDGKELITHCDGDFNKNLHNTMFAGSIYTLATLSGWGWVYLQLQQQQLKGDIVLAKADIKYHAPIAGIGYAKVSAESVSGDFTRLTRGKNARINLTAHLYSGEDIAATFTGSYAVLVPTP